MKCETLFLDALELLVHINMYIVQVQGTMYLVHSTSYVYYVHRCTRERERERDRWVILTPQRNSQVVKSTSLPREVYPLLCYYTTHTTHWVTCTRVCNMSANLSSTLTSCLLHTHGPRTTASQSLGPLLPTLGEQWAPSGRPAVTEPRRRDGSAQPATE